MLSESENRRLFKAIRAGEVDIVETFIAKNGLEAKNSHGWTPLMVAALWGQLPIVKLLLEHNANVNAKSNLGLTPIMLAALQKQREVVRFFLDHDPQR